ncbi:hypothetical protein [Nocardioides sp. GXZ039]|uniref:hypothetical protein n=1 Tax=Nocardioides sp. GXZ039 TaxID=3136018 RepID=UPI0030F3A4D2
MTGDLAVFVQTFSVVTEAFVWLVLALVCLARARRDGVLWAALAALGATSLLVPALTAAAIRLQLVVFDSAQMLVRYSVTPLPTLYPLLRVVGGVLLLAALLVGRRQMAVRPVAARGLGGP